MPHVKSVGIMCNSSAICTKSKDFILVSSYGRILSLFQSLLLCAETLFVAGPFLLLLLLFGGGVIPLGLDV